MLIIFALTLITTLNIQSAEQCTNDWEEKKIDAITVKEHIAHEDTRTYKELQFSFTSASGTHYNPSIKIYLYEDNLLDVQTQKIQVIEGKTTPILCALVGRKIKNFNGEPSITTPVLITAEADYQKPSPFYVTHIPNKDLFDKAFDKVLNQPYNGSVQIYKSNLFSIIDDFYEYLIKKNKAL